MKLFALSILAGLFLGQSLANARPASGSLVSPDTPLKTKEGYTHKILKENYTYDGHGVYIDDSEEVDYQISMTFHEDGLIKTTITDDQGESDYAYQWVFADEDSPDFIVYLFDESGEPVEAGSGYCMDNVCDMSVMIDEDTHLEESFDFSDSFLFKEGLVQSPEDGEGYWIEELELSENKN